MHKSDLFFFTSGRSILHKFSISELFHTFTNTHFYYTTFYKQKELLSFTNTFYLWLPSVTTHSYVAVT